MHHSKSVLRRGWISVSSDFYLVHLPSCGEKCGIQQCQHLPHYTHVTFCKVYETTHTHTHSHAHLASFYRMFFAGFFLRATQGYCKQTFAVVLVGQVTWGIQGSSFLDRTKRWWLWWDLDTPPLHPPSTPIPLQPWSHHLAILHNCRVDLWYY